jgi:dihydrofolate reductase
MRKIILDVAVTLDGFIEGPNGELDWLAAESQTDFGDILNDILQDIDAIFYGRISYDLWGNYQPPESADAKLKQAYALLHSKTRYVFSNTKTSDDRAIIINGDIKQRVEEIRQQPGQNIWLYGGAGLLTTFINLQLVDVYRLAVHPVILGAGKPLFTGIQQRVNLTLTDTQPSPSGVVLMTYERVPYSPFKADGE